MRSQMNLISVASVIWTLLRLAKEIHRFDPERGTRFSTWLFQIAHHVVCGEFTYRNAKKRGEGVRPGALDPTMEPAGQQRSRISSSSTTAP